MVAACLGSCFCGRRVCDVVIWFLAWVRLVFLCFMVVVEVFYWAGCIWLGRVCGPFFVV